MPQDRVLDWQEELRRIERLDDLSPAARQLVDAVVAAFLLEDAGSVAALAA
ncbi:MAG TPA: hypothetical protein VGN27_04665 [Gaiellaceae bacterium]|jgi:RNA processing factor Prp31|nr:hypothetical protein [Gaiellaceae bacterium]